MAFFGVGKIDATANLIEKSGSALNSLFTSDEERLTKKEAIERLRQRPAEWAHQLNLINAQSASWWNSGWRPGIGWVGAISLFFFFVPQYLIASIVWGAQCWEIITGSESLVIVKLPGFPVTAEGLTQLVMLLLGGKAIRSFDKTQQTAKN